MLRETILSDTTLAALRLSKHRRLPTTRRRACRVGAAIAALAVVVAGAAPAVAGTATYDGKWSVVIATTGGACDPTFRYPVAISNGMVGNAGDNAATVEGRVARSGRISVTVRSGDQWAAGSGRLGLTRGGGVWRGQGTSGPCEGTWVAERRSTAGYAERPGAPLYNYAPQDDYASQYNDGPRYGR
jgi:hypothetical protein